MSKKKLEKTLKEIEKKFGTDFDHFNRSKTGKRICNSDCEDEYDLDDVEKWVKQFVARILTKQKKEIRAIVKKEFKKLPYIVGVTRSDVEKRIILIDIIKKIIKL